MDNMFNFKNHNDEVSIKHNEEVISNLTQDQKTKIEELRTLIDSGHKKKWPVVCQDMTLYRFLQARKWVVENALEMLVNHLEWRQKTYPIPKSKWVNDPFFTKGSCLLGSGIDSGGRPILVMKSGRFPVADRNLENCVDGFVALLTEMTNIYGLHTRFTILYDRQNFVKKDNLDLDLLKAIAKIFSDNSPESMERACVYPCGAILRGLWQIVKWFFDPVTRNKISMLGSPEAFKDYVPSDQLMNDMGGTSNFVWEENDEKLWEEFVKLLPEETTDNWKSKQKSCDL
jgi:hypothetical protein